MQEQAYIIIPHLCEYRINKSIARAFLHCKRDWKNSLLPTMLTEQNIFIPALLTVHEVYMLTVCFMYMF